MIILALLHVCGCASRPDPFEVPRDEVSSRINRIAVLSIPRSGTSEASAEPYARIEKKIVDALRSSGVDVVEPEISDGLWLRMATDLDGLYDPMTGKVDAEKRKLAQDAVDLELETTYGAHAALRLGLPERTVWGARGQFEVCDSRVDTYWPGGWDERREDRASQVVVTCLEVVLVDFSGVTLYSSQSAIETVETYAAQTRAILPRTDRYRFENRLDEVVAKILSPLLDVVGSE